MVASLELKNVPSEMSHSTETLTIREEEPFKHPYLEAITAQPLEIPNVHELIEATSPSDRSHRTETQLRQGKEPKNTPLLKVAVAEPLPVSNVHKPREGTSSPADLERSGPQRLLSRPKTPNDPPSGRAPNPPRRQTARDQVPKRLLNAITGQFDECFDHQRVRYVILSHVWATREATYQDVLEIQKVSWLNVVSRLPDKLRGLCNAAQNAGYDFVWADTCCIDRTNSDEISDSITSMYSWYREADECFVYLHDVPSPLMSSDDPYALFRQSIWWSRGWTLPELLAPKDVTFLSSTWLAIGTRTELATLIQAITSIDSEVLIPPRVPLEAMSVATRMSWAASRKTRFVEDGAYCLMGIFGVSMQPNYGERYNAFFRLQELILAKERPDPTLLCWGVVTHLPAGSLPFGGYDHTAHTAVTRAKPLPPRHSKQYLLAASAEEFSRTPRSLKVQGPDVFATRLELPEQDIQTAFEHVPGGIRCRLPLVDMSCPVGKGSSRSVFTLALLACEDARGRMLALLLHPQDCRESSSDTTAENLRHAHPVAGAYFVGAPPRLSKHCPISTNPYSMSAYIHAYTRAFWIPSAELTHLHGWIHMSDIVIAHDPDHLVLDFEYELRRHIEMSAPPGPFAVSLAPWSRDALIAQGYRTFPTAIADILLPASTTSAVHRATATSRAITIRKGTNYIIVQIGRCYCALGERYGLLAVIASESSQSRQSWDRPRMEHSLDHPFNHPHHLCSWSFYGSNARTRLRLTSGMVLNLGLSPMSRPLSPMPLPPTVEKTQGVREKIRAAVKGLQPKITRGTRHQTREIANLIRSKLFLRSRRATEVESTPVTAAMWPSELSSTRLVRSASAPPRLGGNAVGAGYSYALSVGIS